MQNKKCLWIIISVILCGLVLLFGHPGIDTYDGYLNIVITVLCLVLIFGCHGNKNTGVKKNKNKEFVDDLLMKFRIDNPSFDEIFVDHIKSMGTYEIENTWNGCNINFTYKNEPKLTFNKEFIGLKRVIIINDILENFTAEINIKKGKIDFIEVITNGDIELNGEIFRWRFEDK